HRLRRSGPPPSTATRLTRRSVRTATSPFVNRTRPAGASRHRAGVVRRLALDLRKVGKAEPGAGATSVPDRLRHRRVGSVRVKNVHVLLDDRDVVDQVRVGPPRDAGLELRL